jgi:hypothetical protein
MAGLNFLHRRLAKGLQVAAGEADVRRGEESRRSSPFPKHAA